MGPTASGKTDLAVSIVQNFPLEIISVDSALVYCGMDIGTAKPEPEVLLKAPHHLINIRQPQESYSAADFVSDATTLIHEIHSRGNLPLLVGGTMLYFRSLLQGLSELPPADFFTRKQIEDFASKQGLNAVYDRLKEVDPVTAQRLHPHDRQRLLRALEVFELTGKPMSEWYQQKQAMKLAMPCYNFALFPEDRALLHERIALRFKQMLKKGFIEEVQALKRRPGMHKDLPSMKSVGYRQVWDYLEGEYDCACLEEKGIVATRQLAKRQLTWLRNWPLDDKLVLLRKFDTAPIIQGLNRVFETLK